MDSCVLGFFRPVSLGRVLASLKNWSFSHVGFIPEPGWVIDATTSGIGKRLLTRQDSLRMRLARAEGVSCEDVLDYIDKYKLIGTPYDIWEAMVGTALGKGGKTLGKMYCSEFCAFVMNETSGVYPQFSGVSPETLFRDQRIQFYNEGTQVHR